MDVIRTTIDRHLLRKALLRGTALGAVGVILLLLGAFYPPMHLTRWGVVIVLCFILLIAMGLIPYRRLSRLQLHPDEIHLHEEGFTYVHKTAPLFSIQKESIRSVEWRKKGEIYGIAIGLKEPPAEQIELLSEQIKIESFLALSKRRCNCDLFLPYFSEKSSRAFRSLIGPDRAS